MYRGRSQDLPRRRVVTVSEVLTVGSPFDDEPTFNSFWEWSVVRLFLREITDPIVPESPPAHWFC